MHGYFLALVQLLYFSINCIELLYKKNKTHVCALEMLFIIFCNKNEILFECAQLDSLAVRKVQLMVQLFAIIQLFLIIKMPICNIKQHKKLLLFRKITNRKPEVAHIQATNGAPLDNAFEYYNSIYLYSR